MEAIYIWHPIKVNHTLWTLRGFYIYSLMEIFTLAQIGNFIIWSFQHLIGHSLNTWTIGFIQYHFVNIGCFHFAFLITGRESLPLLQPGVGLLLYLYSEFCILYFNIFKFHISILQYYHSLFSSQEFISQAISRGWSTIVMWPDLQKVHFQMKHQSCFIV